jgi:hypothetical protein
MDEKGRGFARIRNAHAQERERESSREDQGRRERRDGAKR